jgi:hypothetical protein
LFGYGSYVYTVLTAVGDEPTPPPATAAPSGAATAAPTPSRSGGGGTGGTSDNTMPVVLGAIAGVSLRAIGLGLMRRRGQREDEE